jgi:hypothetical protein
MESLKVDSMEKIIEIVTYKGYNGCRLLKEEYNGKI